MDVWDDDGCAIDRTPGPKPTSEGWYIDHEMQHLGVHARKRIGGKPVQPSTRAAVATPFAGQSYRPDAKEHKILATKVASALQKKKDKHDAFAANLRLKPEHEYRGNLSGDKLWEEEVVSKQTPLPSNRAKAAAERAAAHEKRQEAKRKKDPRNVLDKRRDARASKHHARHPDRQVVAAQVDEIEKLADEVDKATARCEARMLRRRVAKAEGLDAPTYGRYRHTPLIPDVAITAESSSLRHMKATDAAHPALERMKSIEARGLVPARMRHTYNTRKQGRPPGEVSVKREEFGTLPE